MNGAEIFLNESRKNTFPVDAIQNVQVGYGYIFIQFVNRYGMKMTHREPENEFLMLQLRQYNINIETI